MYLFYRFGSGIYGKLYPPCKIVNKKKMEQLITVSLVLQAQLVTDLYN